MKIRTSWRRTAALVAAGALVLGACSSDEPEADPTSEDSTTEEEPTGEATGEATGEDGMAEVVTGAGVTEEPCPEGAPETVNADNGCIYLGIITDLTQGPFSAAGPILSDGQIAFWTRVNEDGGIGGAYDVNVSEHIRDNLYNPETHNQVYQEMKPDILALAQSLGSPPTQAIAEDLVSSNILAVPGAWTSQHEFQSFILESGNNYCVEAANALDYYAEQNEPPSSVMAVHAPGDYGGDGAAGAKKWADANGATFRNVQVTDSTDAAVGEIANSNPDIVVVTLGPTQTGEVVGGAVGRGYQGFFIGSGPTWNPALLQSPAAEAFLNYYWQAAPWGPLGDDTPAHQAVRDQIEAMQGELENWDPNAPNDFLSSGWMLSYPLKAALEAAYEAGDLTRASVFEAATSLTNVDYEGALPPEAGDFTGDAKNQSFNGTWIAVPDTEAPTGVTTVAANYAGTTSQDFPFEQACYEEEGLG